MDEMEVSVMGENNLTLLIPENEYVKVRPEMRKSVYSNDSIILTGLWVLSLRIKELRRY